MEAEERTVLSSALDEGLSVLQAGNADARRSLLTEPSGLLSALAQPGAAQLWACCLEATEGDVESVASAAAAIVEGCSAVSVVLFTAAVGL